MIKVKLLMATLPASYEQSRDRFRAHLAEIQARWPRATITSYPLPYEPDLTIDTITAPAVEKRDRLLVISTGEHGMEGYAGSAVMELFFAEYLARLDPRSTGLLLVHAINPWGMKHWRRNNPNNVDINRNFIEGAFSSLASTNPDYPRLSAFFSPRKKLGNITLERLLFIDQSMHAIVKYGVKRTREAALMGQYVDPDGILYGGQELQPETKLMMDIYRAAFAGYRQILQLDMHTGYGPREQMTLVISAREAEASQVLAKKFALPNVAGTNPEEFYSIHGDMIDWVYGLVKNEFSGSRIFAAGFEFGTFGDSLMDAIRSLQIMVFRNQLYQVGAKTPSTVAWVEKESREHLCPSDPKWLEKVLADARQGFEGILKAEGML
jgi:hypothetical protein